MPVLFDKPPIMTPKDGESILRLSPSKLIDFENCPKSFNAKYMLVSRDNPTIYTEVGTAMHWVLEQINKGEDRDKTTGEVWDADEREEQITVKLLELCAGAKIPFSTPGGFEKSIPFLREYKMGPEWKFLSSEGKRVLDFPAFHFSYIADYIGLESVDGEPRNVGIIDYKTGQPPKTPVQARAYAWSVWHDFPALRQFNFKSGFYMTQKNQLKWVDTTDVINQFDLYMGNLTERLRMLFIMDRWEATPSSAACHFCPVMDCDDRHGAVRGDWD